MFKNSMNLLGKGFIIYVMCAASRQSSPWIEAVENGVGGKDNEFLSFISKKRE
jgi:hypothetical protein